MRLLFLCTHNACRSVLCEAITRQRARGRIVAASAGSEPRGKVHPATLMQLEQRGYEIGGLLSKGLDALQDFAPDAVVTVCDAAAQESCPIWLANSPCVHWGLPDPTRPGLSAEQAEATFTEVIAVIEARVDRLLEQSRFPLGDDARVALLERAARAS